MRGNAACRGSIAVLPFRYQTETLQTELEFNRLQTESMTNSPSPQIDAAICDLVNQVSNFSDPDFDSQWLELKEIEIEYLVIRLIKALTKNLEGRTLEVYLEEIRNNKSSTMF